jgi:hypothetical protein
MSENNPPNQISLPEHIYKMYSLFEKTSDSKWIDNPFKDFKMIDDIKIKIARNISNLNYYLIDIPFSEKINPKFVLQYIKKIEYRNYFSSDSISFKFLKEINENHWKEEETYSGYKTVFEVFMLNFQIIFFNPNENINTNVSQAKYYHSYKILKNNNEYILRVELVLNNLDIDQEIDVKVYLNMILNILKATYSRFKINFNIIKNKNGIIRSSSFNNQLKNSIDLSKPDNINRPKSTDHQNNMTINDTDEKFTQTDHFSPSKTNNDNKK